MFKRELFAVAVVLAPVAVVLLALALRPSKPSDVEVTDEGTSIAPGTPHVLPRAVAPATAAISGRVTNDDARPIAAANVCVACASCEPIMAPTPRCVVTNAQGRFEITDVAAGGQRVTAQAEGYASGVAFPDILWITQDQSAQGVNIVLRPGGAHVVGSVLDATGGPVSHASIRAIRVFTPAMSLVTETDDDGQFALNLPSGNATLEATAEGYAPTRMMIVAPSEAITLRLTPASRITGRVLTIDDNRPVAGIEVRAAPADNPYAPIHRTARSDHDGSFAIEGLEPGHYALSARGPGFRGIRAEPVELALADVVHDADVIVSRAVRVSGRVIDAHGTPCRQGFATLGPPGPEQSLRRGQPTPASTRSSAPVPALMAMIGMNGEVELEAATPGHYFASVQCFDHVLVDGPEEITVTSEDITDLTWKVAPGLGLRVAIRDGADQPVPNAAFYLRFPTTGGQTPLMPMVSDDDGRAEFPGFMRPGTYQVMPAPPYAGDPVSVELREGSGTAEVTLRIAGSGAITVVVRDQDDVGVDQLQVSASAVHDDTAGPSPSDGQPTMFPAAALGNGRYRIAPLVAGTYQLRIVDGVNAWSASEDARRRVALTEGAKPEIAIRIDRGAELAGVVADDLGDPLANVWVSAAADDAGSAMQTTAPRVLTSLDGHFVISGLAADDSYRVRAEDPAGGVAVADAARAGTTDLRITLPRGVALSGTARDLDGAPIDFATIRATHEASATTRTTQTRAGRWSLSALPAGAIDLVVHDSQGRSATVQVTTQPGERRSAIALTLAPSPLALGAGSTQ